MRHSGRISPIACAALAVALVSVLVAAVLYRSTQEAPGPALIVGSVPPDAVVLPEDAGRFLGSEVCASCHSEQATNHATSLHARTVFAPDSPEALEVFRTTQKLYDKALDCTYTFEVKDGRALSRIRKRDGSTIEMRPAYVIGSGRYGRTPVYERDGTYLEGRASYYPTMRKWWWTPGQIKESPARPIEGRVMGDAETFRCFLCHGTVLSQSGTQPVGPGSRLDIGCERCHGPGREHVTAARAGKRAGGVHSYRAASAGVIMELCSQCHRSPTAVSETDMSQNTDIPRFAGTALAASKCYQLSKGQLSCVTCHNPHSSVETDAGSYERVCLSCHSPGKPEQKPCPVKPETGCIPCHMPRQSIDFPGDVKFHNHWIKPYPSELARAFARKGAARQGARLP